MTRHQDIIAASVRETVRLQYPNEYCSLCHVYAVVGANLVSIVTHRAYKPVAGLAAVDAGGGHIIYMADEQAFVTQGGGSYHCWIESCDDALEDRELVDFTFGHNRAYALKNRLPWLGPMPPSYLWGPFLDLVPQCELSELRPGFGKNRIWLRESAAGGQWLARHLSEHLNGYVSLTAKALRIYQRKVPQRSWADTAGAGLPDLSFATPATGAGYDAAPALQ